MDGALKWLHAHQIDILDHIKSLLRIPSVSADSAHSNDVNLACEWVAKNFERLGLETRILPTSGYPVVYASTKIDISKPTVLCYFHYDVQSAGSDSLWQYPPFEPTEFDGKLFGRGTTDDKMQGMVHVYALEALLNSGEELPVNFKFCIEGEEEVSSPHVGSVLRENQELFACDYIVISDGPMLSPDLPSMEVGARGIVYAQIRVSVGIKDMHSGQFGGYVKNANTELVKILASLKDEKGRIQIPGFYDGIIDPSEEEVTGWNHLNISDEQYRSDAGVFELDGGEEGFSLLERNWTRPTLDINGMWGGFTGEGTKTVIPFEARAKISFRLVPGQDPQNIIRHLEDYLRQFDTQGVNVALEWVESAPPFIATPNDPVFKKAQDAYQDVFGESAPLIRTGGTVGLLADMNAIFNKPILLMNFGSPDENMHAPDEFMRINNFWRGIETSIRLWHKLGHRG